MIVKKAAMVKDDHDVMIMTPLPGTQNTHRRRTRAAKKGEKVNFKFENMRSLYD